MFIALVYVDLMLMLCEIFWCWWLLSDLKNIEFWVAFWIVDFVFICEINRYLLLQFLDLHNTTNFEDINHVIAGCSHMFTRYYLPLRHNEVAKTVLKSHLKKVLSIKRDKVFIWTKIYLWKGPPRILLEYVGKNSHESPS